MSNLNIGIIVGSTRPGRFSEKPARWITEEVKKLEGVEAELLDLRNYPMPFYDQPVSPSGIQDGSYGNEVVREWAKKIGQMDAFVMVSPEYNHGTSAVLKNALDSIYMEWNNKAVGFVSYGSVGGARAIENLRLIAAELQMASVRQAVYVPGSVVFSDNSWNEDVEKSLQRNADTMLAQLQAWGRAFKDAREKKQN